MSTKFFKSLAAAAVAAIIIPAAVGADVIEIDTFEDLLKIGADQAFPLDGDYVLTADIDASGSRDLSSGAGFKPIGERVVTGNLTDPPDPERAFTGTFDGAGHTISGLYINRPQTEDGGHNVGLFGYVQDAVIKNVTVFADTIRGYTYAGILVGRSGGKSVIEQSYTSGFVTVTGNFAGGLVGGNGHASRITACYSTATVEVGSSTAGGLVGANGGLVHDPDGLADPVGGIFHSFSMSTVTGGSGATVGGFVGQHNAVNYIHSRIEYSYSAGKVTGGSTTGGFVGNSFTGGIAGCYWDTERSGQSNGFGSGSAGDLNGRTTEQMTTRTNYAGWFDPSPGLATPHFNIANNYPYLTAFPTHSLTFTSSPGGTVSGSGISGVHTQKVNHGVTAASGVTAEIDGETGESFIGWFLAGEEDILTAGKHDGFTVELLADGLTIKLSDLVGDVEIEARFARKKFTVTYKAGNNGKVAWEAEPDELENELTAEVEFGALGPAVMAVPDNSNFRFHSWRVQIGAQTSPPDTETGHIRADTVREAGMVFTAEFVSAGDAMLTYIAGANGKVAIVPNETSTSGTFVSDTTVSVVLGADGPWVLAEANANYRFIAWSDSSTANPRRELAASGDTAVTAVFAIFTNHYKYTAGPGGKVAIEIDDELTPFVDSLLTVDYFAWGPTVTAVPDEGYEFDRWERLNISTHIGLPDSDSVATTATRSDSTGGWNQFFQMLYEDEEGSGKTVISLDVRAIFKKVVSIAEIDRACPEAKTDETAAFVPVRAASKFVAGPSPVSVGGVVRFYGGAGTLRIFDALGNVVREIKTSDGWDLKDGFGRYVSEGTYVVRGVVTENGDRVNRVRVSVPVTVVK